MFHPIESVTDPENQIPTFKGFTSNANTKIDISKMGKLKPVLPNDAYVSCTVFDQSGNNIAISKRYPKMQFLKDHNLHPRDLRKIDTSLVDVAPQIMIRPPNTILVNLSHIKALIKEEQVMIFDTSSPEIATKLGLFIYDLESKLKAPNNMPFEFKVLETILINVMGYLEAELKVHIQNCGAILSELESQVDRKKLQDLLIRSKGVQSYYQKVLLIKQALETLLDNDEDLAAMYLLKPRTAELKGHTEEIENILESYYSHCDEFVQHSGSLVHDIKATEEIVNIILDANRNSLMLFELKVTIYTLGITFATLVPAFYGMNLKNFIEESQYGFGAVVAFSILQGLFLTMLNLKALNKVQRLTRMGGSSRMALCVDEVHENEKDTLSLSYYEREVCNLEDDER
ncbi:magnesium ion transporter [Yamadazyma tenuis]|uniref:magnesium ion transporter n=1 Tax=Candida tenuis TaxID=2315449 RepID=UPI0027AA0FCF|nr:magnesium ion transporter [Yamadazyma tenuis]